MSAGMSLLVLILAVALSFPATPAVHPPHWTPRCMGCLRPTER